MADDYVCTSFVNGMKVTRIVNCVQQMSGEQRRRNAYRHRDRQRNIETETLADGNTHNKREIVQIERELVEQTDKCRELRR